MKRTKNGYTTKQFAYAQNRLGAKGDTKKEIALASGYSLPVANSVVGKIESTEGYANALGALAMENGNVALKVYAELKNRDLSKIDFEKLLSSITILANAWSVYVPKNEKTSEGGNKLREIVMARVIESEKKDNDPTTVDLDF